MGLELAIEVREVEEAAIVGDGDDVGIGFEEEFAGMADADFEEEGLERFAEGLAEEAVAGGRRDLEAVRHLIHRERFVHVAMDVVEGEVHLVALEGIDRRDVSGARYGSGIRAGGEGVQEFQEGVEAAGWKV